jgi:mono/diheme cytochrome c family protein
MNPDEPKKNSPENGAEPVAGPPTVPIWLIVVFGFLVYWGSLFLAENAGGFSKEVYTPYHAYDEVATSNPQDPLARLRAEGRKIFEVNCAPCHQPSGTGQAGRAPPLAGSEWVLAGNGDRVVHIVMNSVTGPITVKGEEWNLNGMVAWRDTLKDEQITAVLNYIRSQSEWGNKAGPIGLPMVQAARAEKHVGPETADELLKIPVQ